MKPLLIGQAPGPNTDPDHPLAPTPRSGAGGRLADLANLTATQYLRLFDRTNLLHTFPGRTKRDDCLPVREARIAANAMKPLLRGRRVVLVGRNVAEAFGYPGSELEFHEWTMNERWGFEVAVVPHTSGRNHWYRKPGNDDRARAFWLGLVADLKTKKKKRVSNVIDFHNCMSREVAEHLSRQTIHRLRAVTYNG